MTAMPPRGFVRGLRQSQRGCASLETAPFRVARPSPSISSVSWSDYFVLRMSSVFPLSFAGAPSAGLTQRQFRWRGGAVGWPGGCLALKLRQRKHVASGAILTRARCCERYAPYSEELHVPHLFRPACSICPIVRGQVIARNLTFPSLPLPQGANNICRSRSVGCCLNWPEADGLGTHSLGRGAARAFIPDDKLLRADQ